MPRTFSPLRYPGGKSRAVNRIFELMPMHFDEYREAMVGGGSVFLKLLQNKIEVNFLINDIYYDLYCFWRFLKEKGNVMYEDIKNIRNYCDDGQKLFNCLNRNIEWSDYQRAIRFFILNRITFSGTTNSGGYSKESYHKRFTINSIEKLKTVHPLMKNVEVMNVDYKEILNFEGDTPFIFIDPPYMANKKSKLYGEMGDLHCEFNHKDLITSLKKCKYNWLLTIDDSDYIRNSFNNKYKYNIFELDIQYGMDNIKGSKTKLGKEIIITNYLPFKITPI
jgi:DNA adenine methylase